MSTRELIGLSIRDRDNAGHYLGKISNVIFDRNTGRIQYVIIEHGGFLGWDRDRVVVPFSVIGLSGRWDYPTLQAPASKLENAPQIRQGDLDSLLADADWRRAVSDYFRIGLAESDQGGTAASPSGPSESVGGQTASASDATGPTSHPMASPGEGATGTSATSTVGAAAPAAGGEASAGPDPAKGQVIVQRVCAACHTFNQGGPTRVGPNLFGVAHRSIASVSGYNYSAALKGHSGDWDEASLETFLKDPRGFASGTYMTFPGIRSESDRRNVVAYLETLGAAAGAAK